MCVVQAGEGEDGRLKSAIGIGSLLMDGLGDTIRVSLTEDPEYELEPCRSVMPLLPLLPLPLPLLLCRSVMPLPCLCLAYAFAYAFAFAGALQVSHAFACKSLGPVVLASACHEFIHSCITHNFFPWGQVHTVLSASL